MKFQKSCLKATNRMPELRLNLLKMAALEKGGIQALVSSRPTADRTRPGAVARDALLVLADHAEMRLTASTNPVAGLRIHAV